MLELTIVVSDDEFDEAKQEFIEPETITIELEHSLASLSKWEEIWEIPLLSSIDKTDEQNLSYIKCMCLTPDVPPEVFQKLDETHQTQISDYLEKKHTATWFSKDMPSPKSGETITAELIYFWVSSFQIDWEAQYWNLDKLLTLIKVFSVKQDNKPMRQSQRSRQEEISRINNQRRAELGSNG